MLNYKRIASTFTSLSLSLFIIGGISVASATPVTITVDTTADYAEVDDDAGKVDNYTCDFTAGAFFMPAPNGKCTLRRAILEAGVRPDGDRPITIEFIILPSDPNYDAGLKIWEVQIDSSFIWEIDRRYISDDGGQVTIDGGIRVGGGGPAIMVNTNSENNPLGGRSLEIRTSNNTIRNLGFHGGGQITLYEANNLVEDNWMGLTNDGTEMQLASTASAQAKKSLARGGITMPNGNSDDNIIRNNKIIGAFERGIRVTSGGSGNLIENNFIGMNANGIVDVAGLVNCNRNTNYNSALWYGGRGIQVTGSHNTVKDNTLAGLHITQTASETPPISMEVYGTDNLVTGNVVGKDANGTNRGVCGQGLLFGGTESIATNNSFYFSRVGFDPGDTNTENDATIITQSFITQAPGDPNRWLKVWNNVIDGGNNSSANYHANRLQSPGVNIEMRQFIPAKVTSVSGKTIRGTNGDKLFPLSVDPFCPKCEVFLYADDIDSRIESFELLGSTFTDHNGDWVATLSRTLAAGEGLRTQSMSRKDDTMIIKPSPLKHYAANNTTRLSDVLYDNIVAPSLNQNEVLTRRDMAREILKTLSINPPVTATGAAYGDVGSADIHANWIEEFKTRGYTTGCATNKFCPEKAVTREEIAKIILKAKNAFNGSYTPPASSGVYTDVPNGAFNEYWINELQNLSLTAGCAANKFCPKEPVTRKWFEQLLVMVTPPPVACSDDSHCTGIGNEACTASNACGL